MTLSNGHGQNHDEAARIRTEQEIRHDLVGAPPSGWKYRRGGRGGADSWDSYFSALTMPGAPYAMALLRAFAESVTLGQLDGWAMSALPAWAGPEDPFRFSTVSFGQSELFWVECSKEKSQVTGWALKVFPDTAPERGSTIEQLLGLLADPQIQSGIRGRSGKRRSDHNAFLSAVIVPDEKDHSQAPLDRETEIARGYAAYTAKKRLHQRALREISFNVHGERCSYCGLTGRAILETAHIIADSMGGKASADNVRPLCANHHKAFDAGLMAWNGSEFVVAPGASPVAPSPHNPKSGA